MNVSMKQEESRRHRNQFMGYQRENGMEGTNLEFEINRYTLYI